MKNQEKLKINFKFLVIIFIFSFFIFNLANETIAADAFLYLSPSSGMYKVGSTFLITVKVNSGGVAINAAEGIIKFNPAQVNVLSISKSGSIFTLWTQEPTFSNSKGEIVFGGGSPKAFKGTAGTIISITFKAKTTGVASINFSSGMILAADGKGTNVLGNLIGGNYTFKAETISPPTVKEEKVLPVERGVPSAPVVSSPTHPDQERWYSNNDPKFTWKLPSGITKVSYGIDKRPFTNPSFVADTLVNEANYRDLEDGVWYFHINFRNSAGWGKLTHRKVLIDTQPPQPFEIKVDNGGDPTNPSPILVFEAIDNLSGIKHYQVKINEENPFRVGNDQGSMENPYQISPQPPGEYHLLVEAFDQADNFTSASTRFTIQPLQSPIITEIPEALESGENLVVKGTSLYPGATIKIFIQKENKLPVEKETKTDLAGKWAYLHDQLIKAGTYKIWAKVVDSRGAQSLPSEKIILTVTSRSLAEILGLSGMVIILLLIIIGILISFIFYQRREIASKKKWLKREAREIERCVSKTFQALRDEVTEQTNFLNSKPNLSDTEKDVPNRLKKALDISEEFIKKEITDVEKGLK